VSSKCKSAKYQPRTGVTGHTRTSHETNTDGLVSSFGLCPVRFDRASVLSRVEILCNEHTNAHTKAHTSADQPTNHGHTPSHTHHPCHTQRHLAGTTIISWVARQEACCDDNQALSVHTLSLRTLDPIPPSGSPTSARRHDLTICFGVWPSMSPHSSLCISRHHTPRPVTPPRRHPTHSPRRRVAWL
jgi:hypothetical protein